MRIQIASGELAAFKDCLTDIGDQNGVLYIVIRAIAIQQRFQSRMPGLFQATQLIRTRIGKNPRKLFCGVGHEGADDGAIWIEHVTSLRELCTGQRAPVNNSIPVDCAPVVDLDTTSHYE